MRATLSQIPLRERIGRFESNVKRTESNRARNHSAGRRRRGEDVRCSGYPGACAGRTWREGREGARPSTEERG